MNRTTLDYPGKLTGQIDCDDATERYTCRILDADGKVLAETDLPAEWSAAMTWCAETARTICEERGILFGP